MRRDAALAEDYAKRHNVPKWYSNAVDLINDPEVDAVYIATPPSSHKEYTILCAKAGKPVYVEKPMALNFEECNEMISVCKEHNVPLFVAYYRRSLPRFLKIKELIDQNKIGTVRHVNCVLYHPFEERYDDEINLPWTVLPHISGGGIFVDLACHTLDFLDFVLGRSNLFAGMQVLSLKRILLKIRFPCPFYSKMEFTERVYGILPVLNVMTTLILLVIKEKSLSLLSVTTRYIFNIQMAKKKASLLKIHFIFSSLLSKL